MRKRERRQFTSILLGSCVIGLGVGWLAGLSASPVISIIITSVVGIAAAVVTALSGLEDLEEKEDKDDNEEKGKSEEKDTNASKKPTDPNRWRVNPWPLAALLIGLFIGTSAGIWVRTHNWMSPFPLALVVNNQNDIADTVKHWVALGLPQEEVARRFFDIQYPSGTSTSPASETSTASTRDSVLFAAATVAECEAWKKLIEKEDYEGLVIEMKSANTAPFRKLPDIVTNAQTLARIVEEVLCVETSETSP